MADEKKRVDFNAPASLVDRADQVVDILDISRTRLLIDALEDELAERINDETFRRRVSDAYYDGRIDFETVESILGRDEAARMKLLRASIDRSAPDPAFDGELPTDEAFYDGDTPEWAPDEDTST